MLLEGLFDQASSAIKSFSAFEKCPEESFLEKPLGPVRYYGKVLPHRKAFLVKAPKRDGVPHRMTERGLALAKDLGTIFLAIASTVEERPHSRTSRPRCLRHPVSVSLCVGRRLLPPEANPTQMWPRLPGNGSLVATTAALR